MKSMHPGSFFARIARSSKPIEKFVRSQLLLAYISAQSRAVISTYRTYGSLPWANYLSCNASCNASACHSCLVQQIATRPCISMGSEISYTNVSRINEERMSSLSSRRCSPFSSFVLNSLHLKLHRHGWKCKSRYAESGPEGPMARNALLQLLYEVLPLGIDVQLVASEQVDLRGVSMKAI